MQSSSLKSSFWKHLWLPHRLPLILFIFVNVIISSVTGYFTPKLISDFYQSINSDSDFNHHLKLLLGLFVIEYLNRFCFQIGTHRYIQLLLGEIRKQSYSLWLKAPFKRRAGKKHDEYPMGEVLARLMNDTDAVREVVTSGSFAIFIDIIFILSCLIRFLQMNSTTGLALFVIEILACFLLVQGSKYMAKIFMEVRKVTGQMARIITDLTNGLKELFFSPNDRYASKRGEKIFEDFLDKQLKANIWDAGYYSAAESLYPILIAILMIVVPYAKIVEVAILAALIDLIQKSISPIKEIASKISVLQRASTGMVRLTEFNDSFSFGEVERVDFNQLEAQDLNFKLKHFSYDQGFKLENIEFSLKKGQILGILGESGCGKSTLLKLLSGQYQNFDGKLKIDQNVINPQNEKELRHFSSYVSLISQDSHVFTETLEFNITLGYDKDFDQFWQLALSCIPYLKRWNLRITDRINPAKLSMGQKQLLSGLRALYLKKPIILLDEISSGLDSELEMALRDLTKFFQSRSITIIVTHRLETILKADYLLLLDKGCPVAFGSRDNIREEPQFKHFLSHL